MSLEEVIDAGRLYALFIRAGSESQGLVFFTPPELFIQVGQWLYHEGHRSIPHVHVPRPRTADLTQEAIYVVRGTVRVDVYREDGSLIRSAVLSAGDLAVLVAGGHGYTILEDNTKILEFKNGPFTGAAEDRRPLPE